MTLNQMVEALTKKYLAPPPRETLNSFQKTFGPDFLKNAMEKMENKHV